MTHTNSEIQDSLHVHQQALDFPTTIILSATQTAIKAVSSRTTMEDQLAPKAAQELQSSPTLMITTLYTKTQQSLSRTIGVDVVICQAER